MTLASTSNDAGRDAWVAELLPQAYRHADWRRVRGYYQQAGEVVDRAADRIPVEMREGLADALLEVSAGYVGSEELMCAHALAVLANADGHEWIDPVRRRAYYEDDRLAVSDRAATDTRRTPGLVESLIETCRRRRDAHRLREAFLGTRTSGLMVGSTAYGPFHNVRGNRDKSSASDLDFVIIAETADTVQLIATRLAMLPQVCGQDVDQFIRRGRIFADRLDNGRTVFSHKLRLWPSGTDDPLLHNTIAPADYLLSLHVMTRPVLDHVLVSSTPRLTAEESGTRRTVQDYREAPRGQQDHVRTFAARSHYLDLATVAVAGGYIRSPRVYYIDESGAYCPGFYQTMLMPQPTASWDDLDTRPALARFRAKIGERLRYEAQQRRYAILRPSFAHLRRHAFTPHIIRSLDEGY
jgi:hypothetical protein